jgi:transcriptional regulator with XRE-family HTH domain
MSICRWELGRTQKPSAEDLLKVSDVTGIPFDWLAFGRGESPCEAMAVARAESREKRKRKPRRKAAA